MVDAVKEFFTKYATFSGRTSRKTFWLAVLGIMLITMVIGFVFGLIGGLVGDKAGTIFVVVPYLFVLSTLLPSLAMEVRRMHDINKSGWFVLVSFIPFVGSIILIVLLCMPAVDEGNTY